MFILATSTRADINTFEDQTSTMQKIKYCCIVTEIREYHNTAPLDAALYRPSNSVVPYMILVGLWCKGLLLPIPARRYQDSISFMPIYRRVFPGHAIILRGFVRDWSRLQGPPGQAKEKVAVGTVPVHG